MVCRRYNLSADAINFNGFRSCLTKKASGRYSAAAFGIRCASIRSRDVVAKNLKIQTSLAELLTLFAPNVVMFERLKTIEFIRMKKLLVTSRKNMDSHSLKSTWNYPNRQELK